MTDNARLSPLAALVSRLRRGPFGRSSCGPGDGVAARSPATVGAVPAGDPLEAERAGLRRGARLSRLHWCIVAGSMLVTAAAWQHSRQLVAGRSTDRFERERAALADRLTERFARYEDVLRAGAATLASHGGALSDARWSAFVEGVDIGARYPGVSSLAVARAVPDERLDRFVAVERRRRPGFRVRRAVPRRSHLVISRIEPADSMEHARGLDLRHEPRRAAAADAARDAGEPRITAPVPLVRAADRAPGIVFMFPVYGRLASVPATLEARRAAFTGVVVAPFALDGLPSGALARDARRVAMRIVDAGETLVDELGPADAAFDPRPLHRESFELDVHGRTWRVDVATDLAFRADAGLGTPWAVLAAGLGMDAALFALFVSLTRGNRRALGFADRTLAALRERMAALSRSNAELESFAHAVSHDLKTPVRGIGNLVEFLTEDLGEHLDLDAEAPEIARHLGRLGEQQRRVTHLIDSVLAYSALGREHAIRETLDVRAVLAALARELGLDDGRLTVSGDAPVFRTQAVRFEQVVGHLLENACRHFEGDPAELEIDVEIAPSPGGWSLVIRDNGPGIEPRFHDVVFDVFRRLRPKDDVEGSGVGLSIVKRSVETLGGSVSLSSDPGEGCTFELFWPVEADLAEDDPSPGAEEDAPPDRAARTLAA